MDEERSVPLSDLALNDQEYIDFSSLNLPGPEIAMAMESCADYGGVSGAQESREHNESARCENGSQSDTSETRYDGSPIRERAQWPKTASEILRENCNHIQQRYFENDVILKGFPDKPNNVEEVVENFQKIFNICTDEIKEAYYVCHTLKNRHSLQTNGKRVHLMVFSFKKKLTKNLLFIKKRAHGPLFLGALDPTQAAESDTQIVIAHKLTQFNLIVQSRLYKAKQLHVIKTYCYHNNMFLCKINWNEDWNRIETYSDVNFIEFLIRHRNIII